MSENKEQMLAKRKPGRPREYDAEKIAEELVEWVKDEESINFAQFCADRGYLPGLIWRLEKEYEDFAYAYAICKLKLAERRERHMNAGVLNYGSYERYQYGYDAFLAKSEDDESDKDANRKKGIAQQQQMNLFTLAQLAAKGQIKQDD